MDRYKKDIGDIGEEFATRFLIKNGYKIFERNYNSKFGEIDIIALDKDCISFVEVKTRTNSKFDSPAYAVGRTKKAHITRTALNYINHKRLNNYFMRFDIIEVIMKEGKLESINHIKNAFEAVRW